MKADKLIREIMSDPKRAEDGELANELLREFHRGYPIENLRPLLSSGEEEVMKTGVFIAAELGSKAAPLLPEVACLLKHPAKWVRSDVIDSVLTCATGKNQEEIAAVVSMLDDPDGAIRWKVMEFLSLASLDQLGGGLQHFEKTDSGSAHIQGLHWLTSENGRNVDEITSWLRGATASHRKYGVVAAARLAAINNSPLVLASTMDDDDVKQFAEGILKK